MSNKQRDIAAQVHGDGWTSLSNGMNYGPSTRSVVTPISLVVMKSKCWHTFFLSMLALARDLAESNAGQGCGKRHTDQ